MDKFIDYIKQKFGISDIKIEPNKIIIKDSLVTLILSYSNGIWEKNVLLSKNYDVQIPNKRRRMYSEQKERKQTFLTIAEALSFFALK